MALDIMIFAAVSIIGVLFSALVFVFKDILHSAVALAVVFIMNSALFLLLQQPLLAIIQLFIMVGGITTFLFVGVASAQAAKFRFTRIATLAVLWAVFFVVIAYPLMGVQFQTSQQPSSFGVVGISQSLSGSSVLFYVILSLMFSVALGAVLLLKKAGARK